MKRWLQRLHPAPAANDAQLAELQRQLDIARAVEAERRRIHDDLHDDVGSQLLTLLHRVPPAEQQLVREILQDLRAILARERGVEGTLLEVLAQLHEEAEQRLQTRDIGLDWQQADDLPDPPLDPAQAMHLFRIGRESITNALRHAHPARLRVVIETVGAHVLSSEAIVDRASADLVATINQHVGELLRAYVAEAIEREIDRWRASH